MATGELADALHRDLTSDRLSFDDLGWRGLWAYITKAPPGTAIHHLRSEGWGTGLDLELEQINELRELNWRYTAVHFKGGSDKPIPQRITRESLTAETSSAATVTWESVTVEELVSPEVRALLQS